MNSTKILVNNPFYSGDTVIKAIKQCLFSLTIMAGVYGLIANSLILYYMHIKRRVNHLQAFSHRGIVDRFMQSLALSDVLCCVISFPVYANEILTNFINTDVMCKGSRYVMFFFPVVTAMNYLFIGIERYLGLFHPLKLPSRSVCEKCIVLSWILGMLLTALPIPTYVIQHYDLTNTTYTYICNYNTSSRFLFGLFILLGYIIPSVILIVTCICIRKLIARRRAVVPRENEANKSTSDSTNTSGRSQTSSSRRYNLASMFVTLIFAFILPYIVFVTYSCVLIQIELKVSFHVHYTTRMISALFVYGNTAIGSSIMFYNSKYLRRKLFSLIRLVRCTQQTIQTIEIIEMRNMGGRNQNL